VDLRPIAAAAPKVPLHGTVLRLVQQQGIDSLAPLVDDLSQLARLEALVESSKPPLLATACAGPNHSLLTTPFRYSPLRHGSRFGSRLHRGIFYGSRSRSGSLVEGAFYALLFWEGLIEPPPGPIRRRQTLFSVLLKATRGLKLQAISNATTQAVLRDPAAYGATQQLGEWMRDQGVEAFEYFSARSSEALVQLGVFTPAVFQSTPFDQVEITTELTAAHVSFLCHDDGRLHRFPRQLFLIDGQLPRAAAT
jgi:hypothetical protein